MVSPYALCSRVRDAGRISRGKSARADLNAKSMSPDRTEMLMTGVGPRRVKSLSEFKAPASVGRRFRRLQDEKFDGSSQAGQRGPSLE